MSLPSSRLALRRPQFVKVESSQKTSHAYRAPLYSNDLACSQSPRAAAPRLNKHHTYRSHPRNAHPSALDMHTQKTEPTEVKPAATPAGPRIHGSRPSSPNPSPCPVAARLAACRNPISEAGYIKPSGPADWRSPQTIPVLHEVFCCPPFSVCAQKGLGQGRLPVEGVAGQAGLVACCLLCVLCIASA